MEGKPHFVGWRSILDESPSELFIGLAYQGEDGEICEGFEPTVVWLGNNTFSSKVERERAKILVDALCRYFNAGGTACEALMITGQIFDNVSDSAMQTPEHRLVHVEEDVNISLIYENIFNGDVVHIVPDEFAEIITEKDFMNECCGYTGEYDYGDDGEHYIHGI